MITGSSRTYALETQQGDRVVVRGGRVARAGDEAGLTVAVGSGELRPGLINAHDHLYLNHFGPLGVPPYSNMYAWGRDVQSRFAAEVERGSALPREEALLFGALKNLIGGVTTVVHHDRWHPMLDDEFPIRVHPVRVVHSLGFEPDPVTAARGDERTRGYPLSMHLAEGVDDVAHGEVAAADRIGLLSPEMLAVHLVGVSTQDVELLRARGVGLVWCPSSNRNLYGASVPRELVNGGLDVLIGTDSFLSADGTMLDELRAARALKLVDDAVLVDAVGAIAARRLGLPLPSLEVGAQADLVLLRRPLFEARARDVGLVVVDGVPRYGDTEFEGLFAACGVEVERLDVGGAAKLVSAPLGAVARRVLELTPGCGRMFD